VDGQVKGLGRWSGTREATLQGCVCRQATREGNRGSGGNCSSSGGSSSSSSSSGSGICLLLRVWAQRGRWRQDGFAGLILAVPIIYTLMQQDAAAMRLQGATELAALAQPQPRHCRDPTCAACPALPNQPPSQPTSLYMPCQ